MWIDVKTSFQKLFYAMNSRTIAISEISNHDKDWQGINRTDASKRQEALWQCINFCKLILAKGRSSQRRSSIRKGVLRNFTKFTRKPLCQSLFFNKVAALRPETLLKKRLWHMCFPVNFAKFLRAPFLQNISRRLLLKMNFCISVLFEIWLYVIFWSSFISMVFQKNSPMYKLKLLLKLLIERFYNFFSGFTRFCHLTTKTVWKYQKQSPRGVLQN